MTPATVQGSLDSASTHYRGRFAPSPTGPLHRGSLLAAVASYLRARQAGGEWLLRIEDIDPPREAKGAADSFLTVLDAFGFEWDGPVTYQSQRFDLYREALDALGESSLIYRCRCSRKDIQSAIASRGGPPGVYPGTCLDRSPPASVNTSHRVKTEDTVIHFTDRLQGDQYVHFGKDQGDFVVWRKDDLPSYQLAVTVDDIAQDITEVVRGIDLLHETAGQILIRQSLAPSLSRWMHIPVLVNAQGEKLSKQTAAKPLDVAYAAQQLCAALEALGLTIDPALTSAAVRDIWPYAIEHWQPNNLANQQKIILD